MLLWRNWNLPHQHRLLMISLKNTWRTIKKRYCKKSTPSLKIVDKPADIIYCYSYKKKKKRKRKEKAPVEIDTTVSEKPTQCFSFEELMELESSDTPIERKTTLLSEYSETDLVIKYQEYLNNQKETLTEEISKIFNR